MLCSGTLGRVSIYTDLGTVFKGSDLAPCFSSLFTLRSRELKMPPWGLGVAADPS